MRQFQGICTVCSGIKFVESAVLWPALINSWQLSEAEVAYINRQQGYYCKQCFNNLRALGIASAILREYNFAGCLKEFCSSGFDLAVLEINRAGNLTSFLDKIPNHKLIEYPQFDMLDLQLESESFDLILHSDTLEHIPNPERAMTECNRLLRKNGKCIFTVPIVVDRLNRSRIGLSPSYHGQAFINADEMLVHSEFGADIWKIVLNAGFLSCEIYCFEYPAALILIARK